jgi:tetratricopeptide (TPR) repeat protein
MKTVKCTTIIVWIMFFVLPINLLAQVKEIPITTSSKEALNFFKSGRDKIENIEFVSASALFEKAIQKDPGFAMAYLLRSQSGGGYSVFRKNLDKAISLVDKVSEGEKLQIEYYQAIADGNGQKQKENLDKLLKTFPSDKRVQGLAGEYYYGINDFSTALVHFIKASELDSKYAPVYNMIGYCQSALNNYQAAEKAFQTYIKLIPNNPNPYDSYAELLLKTGKYDESVAQYKKAIAKDPLFTSSLAGIGNNYVFKGEYETARKYYGDYFDKAKVINGKLEALFLKAVSYLYEGKTDKALSVFEERRILAEKENQPFSAISSYAIQAEILTETGNPVEGTKYYEKANDLIQKSKIPEADKENLEMNSMFWHFYSLTANNELEKASGIAEKCKQKVESRKNPGEEMTFYALSAYYESSKGNYDKAIQYFSKADQQDPWNWYYTAVAYSKKGDKQNASKLFEKITKWNLNSLNLALVRKSAMEEMKK